MEATVIIIFVIGYLLIALEHPISVNKSATAIVTGVLCWTIYILFSEQSIEHISHQLAEHFGEISAILFFLLGAMTIVELVDGYEGFKIITDRIKTKNPKKLLWIICGVTFFLSAILDNLTTSIVMVSLARKLVPNKEMRMFFCWHDSNRCQRWGSLVTHWRCNNNYVMDWRTNFLCQYY